MHKDLWRGRLKDNKIDSKIKQYISSIEDDKRIIEIDIDVAESHCLMLYKQGYITKKEIKLILTGFENARKQWQEGKLKLDTENFNDIHPAIEKYIIDMTDIEVGGKIHSAKSRNDQVCADIRISARNDIIKIIDMVISFNETLIKISQSHIDTVMACYTHLQSAQTTSFAHYLLSYVDVLNRDIEKLFEIYSRINLNPLGAGALAGSSLKIDRYYTSKLLGFDGIIENTIDAVSNRDFMLELGCELGNIMVTLSRIAEDLIIWSTPEFNIVALDDKVVDISTAMPQKKNPDPLELLRGKTSTVIGLVNQLFIIGKGLPTGYNRDLQETKISLWKIIDITVSSLDIIKTVFETLTINKERMKELVIRNYVLATDLVEYLILKKNISFRQANYLVGNIVRKMVSGLIYLKDITPDTIERISLESIGKKIILTKDEINKVFDPYESITRKTNIGSPSPEEVKRMINTRKQVLNNNNKKLTELRVRLKNSHKLLTSTINELVR